MDSTLNFRLFRKNGRILNPKESRAGRILFWDRTGDEDTNLPHVCIQLRNNYLWKALHELSGPKFHKHKVKITQNLREMFKAYRKEVNSHNVTKRKLESAYDINTEMFVFMYNKMSKLEKEEFIEKYPEQKERISHLTCNVCNNITSKPFVKCRHDDCTSMCETCLHNWENGSPIQNGMFVFGHVACDKETCPSCKKSQLYDCPICYDTCSKDKMMFSDFCNHSICKNCFCNSFDSNPIVDCPMCRKQFRKTLQKTSYNDGFMEDALVV